MYDWRHRYTPICFPNYDINESQCGFQIGVMRGDAPNWLLLYIPDLGKLLVLYFNKNTAAFRGCWLQVPLYTSVNNNMTDVMKDAFLMSMCPHPAGFLLTVARFLEFQVVTAGFLLTVAFCSRGSRLSLLPCSRAPDHHCCWLPACCCPGHVDHWTSLHRCYWYPQLLWRPWFLWLWTQRLRNVF